MHEISPSSNAAVDDAIDSRQSVRAFLPTPVERSTVVQLLGLAARSASGSNIQPWRVRVIAGDIKERVTKAIFDAVARDGFEPYQREWNYYPVNWREPFLGRRRKIGWDMYSLLGVAKGDFDGTQRARMNYEFFGVPVGMIFTLDEDLEIGSWLDLGTYPGMPMVAPRGHGLHTCPQAAFADFHKVIRRCSIFPKRKSSSAEWRSVISTRRRPSTGWSPNARRFPIMPASMASEATR